MSTPVIPPEVADFVSAVRQQLDDLEPDVVEDLTDGLGADLTESLLEPGGTLPDPVAYAAELRAAADLPARDAAGGSRAVNARDTLVGAARWARTTFRTAQRQPWWPTVLQWYGFAAVIWWVARGWLIAMIVGVTASGRWPGFVPESLTGRLVLLVSVAASIEFGRRVRTIRIRPLQLGLVAVNLLLLTQLPAAVANSEQTAVRYVPTGGVTVPQQGVWAQGREVRNIFPYDAQGRPLQGVRLLTDVGQPLKVGRSAAEPILDVSGRLVSQVPSFDSSGEPVWYAFPLRQRVLEDENGPTAETAAQPADPPMATLGALPQPPGAPAPPVTTTSP